MTALRLLGLAVLLACAWVLGVEMRAYEPDGAGGRIGAGTDRLEAWLPTLPVSQDAIATVWHKWLPLSEGCETPTSTGCSELGPALQDSSMAGDADEPTGTPYRQIVLPPAAEAVDRMSTPEPSDRSGYDAMATGDLATAAGSAAAGGDTGEVGPVRRMRNVRFTFYIDRGVTRWGCEAGPGIAATDPAVIPPMTRFRIVGWPGEWLACDTGSMVRGQHIDAWQPSLEAGRAFIRQMGETGEIEILRWGP